MAELSTLDWIICGGYLAVVLGLGVWFSRQQHTNEDYFLGGRKMHWLPIGLSIFAGTFSSLSFVGLPREAAYDDYHLFLGILFIPLVVMPIVGWLFIPMYHRMRITSAYEYLEQRFDRGVRLLAALLFTLYTIGWMGNLLIAVGKILQVVLVLSEPQLIVTLVAVGLFATLYTTMGGVQAVVWTDALQAFALGGGMLAVLWLAVGQVDGGWQTVWETGNAHGRFEMFNMSLDFERPNFYAACAFGFFVYLAGHAVHFTAVQRYVSMPTVADARRSLVVNGIMVAAVCLVFFLVGSTLFAFYQQHAGTSNGAVYHELHAAHQGDQLLPHFVLHQIPGYGLTGLLVAGLFAAAMSSMDSGVNSLTASVVCDWMSGRNITLHMSRVLSFLFGVAAIVIAVILQRIGGPVFHMMMSIAGTFLGLMLGVFLLGMFCKTANAAGAWIGVGVGVIALLVGRNAETLLIPLFDLTGVTSWQPVNLSFWWDGASTTVATFVGGFIASQVFRSPADAVSGATDSM